MISEELLVDAIKKMLVKANTVLPKKCFELVNNFCDLETKNLIVSNCKIAKETSRPLCQDTGQVLVFIEFPFGKVFDFDFKSVINKTVAQVYEEEFYRKSVVKDAFFDRENTKNNTPVIIYTDFKDRDSIKIDILIKGGGAENMSFVKMFEPTIEQEELKDILAKEISKRAKNACPPLFIGIGIGGTMDYSALLSKKALFDGVEDEFCVDLKNKIDDNQALSVQLLSAQTHIASLPVAVTINCHSNRHSSCEIINDTVIFTDEEYDINTSEPDFSNYKKVSTVEEIKDLRQGDKILLSGTIYSMRDMAHKKLCKMIENDEKLPFEIKNSIIFYAGPVPQKNGEVIGPVGPTTAKRMDKFATQLYNLGCLATIGKGNRSIEVENSIKKNNAHYFSAKGGVACLLQKCFLSAEIIAFEELGTEAICKFEVKDLPLKVEI